MSEQAGDKRSLLHRAASGLGRLVDYTILPFAPRRFYRRRAMRHLGEQFRELATHRSAKVDRTKRAWGTSNTSAASIVSADAGSLNARARASVRDDAYGVSGQSAYLRTVIGTGITPRAMCRHPETRDELTDLNRRQDRWWGWWSKDAELCDVEGKRTFHMFQRQSIRELIANGNWMVAEVYDPRPDMVGYQLQAFEYEQLDDSVTSHNGRDVVEGVEVDEYGKAVAYHVQLSGHPLDDLVWPTNSIRIKRERVIHLMDPERIKQPLGLTLMHAVLSDLRQFQMYREFEMLAAKYQACFGGIIIDDASQGNTFNPGIANPVEPGSSDDAEDSKGNPELNLEPGMFPRVRGAQDVKFLAPTKPGNMYAPFSQQTIGQVAAGLDADIHSLSRDYTGATYVGLRMAKGDMYDAMDPWQVIMIDLFCRRVWRRFQSYAIREGRYGGLAPNWGRDLEWDEAYLQADWQPPPKRDVDEAKAAMGRKVDLEQGVRTLQIIANQMGADWRDLIEDRGAVQELADRFNVVLPFLDPNAKANPGEPKPRGESPKPAQPEDN